MRNAILILVLLVATFSVSAQNTDRRPISELHIENEYPPGGAYPNYVNITFPKGVKEDARFVFYTADGKVVDNVSGYHNGKNEWLQYICSFDCSNTKMLYVESDKELLWNNQKIVSYNLR